MVRVAGVRRVGVEQTKALSFTFKSKQKDLCLFQNHKFNNTRIFKMILTLKGIHIPCLIYHHHHFPSMPAPP
jgi:hypothetical protein